MANNKFKSFLITSVLTILCFLTHCQCDNEFGNRILNGFSAEPYQFPYQISIQVNNEHHCGGSIISEGKVLTAGHCITNEAGRLLPTSRFHILAGTNNLKVKGNLYSVKKFSIHPKFDRPSIQYDYAVIFLNGRFDLESKKISIIPLATQDPLPGTICFISGWGDVDKINGIPNELQFARITIDPPEVCERIFGNFFSPRHMLCAGKSNKENAGCGDSGGPLVCNNMLSGIVSFGNEYYDSKFPDVYSSVIYASEWIYTTNGTTSGSRKHTNGSFYCVATFTLLFITQIMLSK